MLKVTLIEDGPKTITLKLEGRIAGQWVDELERECEKQLETHKKLVLDVFGVTFVDDRGIRMLMSVGGDRVELIRCSLFISELLRTEGIHRESRPRRCKPEEPGV